MDLDSKVAYLLLGSNLGDSRKLIDSAIALINNRIGPVKSQSSYYRTAAWGKTDQPDFINIALEIETKFTAAKLLKEVLAIELDLGRIRHEKWGARLIDIDIIFYSNDIIEELDLKVPHPEMHNRKFVLAPLNEIAPNYVHPIINRPIEELLSALNDSLAVDKTQ